MRPFVFILPLVLLIGLSAAGYSATINVPGDYLLIQQAIDASAGGDTVLVAPGTYPETIDYKGKAILVKSSHGAVLTVIDGNQAGVSVVTFRTGESSTSVLEDFTITNGSAGYGGGIHCNQASPVITKCRITSNTADYDGGGIWCNDGSSPEISKCVLTGNAATLYDGGGIYCYYNSSPVISSCTLKGNTAYYHGGGIYCDGSPLLTVKNCDISGNTLTYGVGGGVACFDSLLVLANNHINDNFAYKHGGAVYCYDGISLMANCTMMGNSAYYLSGGIACDKTDFTVANTILRGSSAATGPEIWIGSAPSSITISYSDLEGGQSSVQVDPGATLNWGAGMIDAVPLFADAAGKDYHLTFPSPCREAGDNSSVLDVCDFEGDPRIAYGVTDMGADEFHTHFYYTGAAAPGGGVALKFVGLPGTAPVQLWLGSGVLEPPVATKYGDWYLKYPLLLQLQFGSIPANGILSLPFTIPPSTPAPLVLPFQAGVGAQLTNLCVMVIE